MRGYGGPAGLYNELAVNRKDAVCVHAAVCGSFRKVVSSSPCLDVLANARVRRCRHVAPLWAVLPARDPLLLTALVQCLPADACMCQLASATLDSSIASNPHPSLPLTAHNLCSALHCPHPPWRSTGTATGLRGASGS